jgi:biopolymer transport protein ExbD
VKFKRQTKAQLEINLTPLIDVVFLLLIFFMVTTTFTKESRLTVDLPEAQGVAQEQQKEQLEITIAADGKYAVNGKALVNSKPEVLKAALVELSGGDSSLPLVITADALTPHQAVVTAMDVAGQLRFIHLSITTQQPAQQ